MTELRALVEDAVADLCTRFEHGGYTAMPVVDLGVLVARADGSMDEKERETLREAFEALLETRLNAEVVGHLITASLEVIEAAGADARARLIVEILKDCDAVEQGVIVALFIAFASEGLSTNERSVIAQIARAGGLSEERFQELIVRVRAKLPETGSARDSLQSPASRR